MKRRENHTFIAVLAFVSCVGAIFEIRAGLETPTLFARESGEIVLVFAGNHNQVWTWLKENV